MTLESLAKQGREKIYTNLAEIDAAKLKKMRNETLRRCFSSFDDMKYKLDFVARINGMEFVNDELHNFRHIVHGTFCITGDVHTL